MWFVTLIHIIKYRKDYLWQETTALDVLIKYQNEQSYLNITLNDYLEKSLLSRNDKDLATRIVYGTIQNKLYLEYQLAPYIQGKKLKIVRK